MYYKRIKLEKKGTKYWKSERRADESRTEIHKKGKKTHRTFPKVAKISGRFHKPVLRTFIEPVANAFIGPTYPKDRL